MLSGMPLEELHVILTYRCVYQCDHCFVFSGPLQGGTFTSLELEGLLTQAGALEGVTTVYFEGGEPCLYFPLLLEGVRMCGTLGLGAGLVSCGYFATNVPDAMMWLGPLRDAGLSTLEVSVDELHGLGEAYTSARNLLEGAERLGLRTSALSCVDPRKWEEGKSPVPLPGEPYPAFLRGRAARELSEGLEGRPWSSFTECSSEDLERPRRVHVDPYGNVHVCQGIVVGNVWESSLAQIVRGYDPKSHPILGPLVSGGPAELIRRHAGDLEGTFATECHACYEARRRIRPEFPRQLAPAQVYGEEPEPPPACYE